MNKVFSHAFLTSKLSYTPARMLAYIKSRARVSSKEDIEDILQNALTLVVKYYDPDKGNANLSSFCLGACNKAIAQNLERYHKINMTKSKSSQSAEAQLNTDVDIESTDDSIQTIADVSNYESRYGGYRTVSLDSMFDEDDSRSFDEVFSGNMDDSKVFKQDPLQKAMLNELIDLILKELPSKNHKICFVLKFVHGYKREDIISCLKMDAKSIDTIDKKIVRTLKSFKDRLDSSEKF